MVPNIRKDMDCLKDSIHAPGLGRYLVRTGKDVYKRQPYDKSEAPAIASLYGVELIQVTDYPLSQHFPLVLDC